MPTLGLYTLPVELLREILYLSIDKDKEQHPRLFLRRVLVLQSICRYFRDVVRESPDFWTSLTSSVRQLFELQLQRSKNLGLSFNLVVDNIDLLDSPGLIDMFVCQANRWRKLHIDLVGFNDVKLYFELPSSVNFNNIAKLEIHYFPYAELAVIDNRGPPVNNVFDTMISQTPNLEHLYWINTAPMCFAPTRFTSVSVLIEDDAFWFKGSLLRFIPNQPRLRSLHLDIRDMPIDVLEETSMVGKGVQAVEVSLVLRQHTTILSLSPVWPVLISIISIAHLNINVSDFSDYMRDDGSFCHALHFASSLYVAELRTLTISFCTPSLPVPGCRHDNHNNYELPASLQMLAARNCPSAALEIIRTLVTRLLEQQAALGVPPLAKLVLTGILPSEADRMPMEILSGKDRIHLR